MYISDYCRNGRLLGPSQRAPSTDGQYSMTDPSIGRDKIGLTPRRCLRPQVADMFVTRIGATDRVKSPRVARRSGSCAAPFTRVASPRRRRAAAELLFRG